VIGLKLVQRLSGSQLTNRHQVGIARKDRGSTNRCSAAGDLVETYCVGTVSRELKRAVVLYNYIDYMPCIDWLVIFSFRV
jgi:hypothetical protein